MIEYVFGFVSGLFLFQALMMMPMVGSYGQAVRKTFFAETVSMHMVMTGMIPTMVLLTAAWPGSEDPLTPQFWFRMSLATIVGAVIAFPINKWLVANHLKHGCMTLPDADGPAPALGHKSPEHNEMSNHSGHQAAGHLHMEMKSLTVGNATAWLISTSVLLIAALWLTSKFVLINF